MYSMRSLRARPMRTLLPEPETAPVMARYGVGRHLWSSTMRETLAIRLMPSLANRKVPI